MSETRVIIIISRWADYHAFCFTISVSHAMNAGTAPSRMRAKMLIGHYLVKPPPHVFDDHLMT